MKMNELSAATSDEGSKWAKNDSV